MDGSKHEQAEPPASQLVSGSMHNSKKYPVIIAALIVIATVAVLGTYSWQHKKLNDSLTQNKQLSSQLTTLKQIKTSTASASKQTTPETQVNNQLITGQVDFDKNNLRGQTGIMYLDAYVKPSGDLKEIWMDYGTNVDNLNLQTEHITKELGLGDANQYGNFTFTLKKADLKPGTIYFYRLSATKGTTVIHSDTAAFTSLK